MLRIFPMAGAYSFLRFRTSLHPNSVPFFRNVQVAAFFTASVRNKFLKCIPASLHSLPKPKLSNGKDRFTQKNPRLNVDKYTQISKNLFSILYPKNSSDWYFSFNKEVFTREFVTLCSERNCSDSKPSSTYLEHLKLPIWVFSYLFIESIELISFIKEVESSV